MRDRDPDVRLGAIWLNNEHIWIGDVDTDELAVWLTAVDEDVREWCAASGSPIPSADTVLKLAAA
jgi:hypothetical protein